MSYALIQQPTGLYLEPKTEKIYEQTKKGLYILIADLKNDILIREPSELENKLN